MASTRDDASIAGSSVNAPNGATGAAIPSTFAAFSPVTLSASTPSRSARRSTVLVHQKSPLLLATPPQITRALAYSHPFLLPLNTFVGLLTWSSGDPWQSFLLLSAFWMAVLYGDVIVIRAGPVAVGAGLIIAMYGRRYSPLSSSSWSGAFGNPKLKQRSSSTTTASLTSTHSIGVEEPGRQTPSHKRNKSEVTATKHQKTLDEIVETLKEFTSRCNILMDPLLEMTDFLSTQQTATSATTRPALIAIFMRFMIVTPFWYALTFPPFKVITTKRVILIIGTIILSWHARPMRVTRTLLWRSTTVRRLAGIVTGLQFDGPGRNAAALQLEKARQAELGHKRSGSKAGRPAGVKFTFIIYENQRRWIGLGWTPSLFAYERAAWTDEHNNAVPARDDFQLPNVEDGSKMKWEWAETSRWRVDGVPDEHGPVEYDGEEGRNGWIYYDNKWQYGRRGQDGWAKWTRRRKWYRDAELVEMDEDEDEPSFYGNSYATAVDAKATIPEIVTSDADNASVKTHDDSASVHSTSSRSFWPLRRRTTDRSSLDKSRDVKPPNDVQSDTTSIHTIDDDAASLNLEAQMAMQKQGQWGIGDEARMGLE
ncbi:hypothetical protein VHEMI00098 [[Torrubiella] hemipterigena]|nr:hypothetical protein VHEMI00098 [[Torrubiella] hemipterigena]